MNIATQKIKAKGYKLPEALKLLGISLSTYRRYEDKDNDNHDMLIRLISELENKPLSLSRRGRGEELDKALARALRNELENK